MRLKLIWPNVILSRKIPKIRTKAKVAAPVGKAIRFAMAKVGVSFNSSGIKRMKGGNRIFSPSIISQIM